ncbi:MAG: hypothetical protein HOP12_04115 [Candidatus Eisenbacteria bacterium]|uniref:Glycosyltransferase RgtA/B/C/D-like domain-containing protein n=1 Tax=Eiseniibacteriota bacterium TaxID=2212470 RepID=A0A849SCB6_UNCEI|nr:hypothetical protein [Candidatus Eisenbacteria bacterium]
MNHPEPSKPAAPGNPLHIAGFAALFLLGLGLLYAGALRIGFLNDDFLFLEAARGHSFGSWATSLGPLGNYYRPVSRPLYFEVLGPLAGGHPLLYHLVSAALFVAALGLLARLLWALAGGAGAAFGLLYFALLPLQRVNLTWISCAQELLALTFGLAAFEAFRARRNWLAALAFALALFSKESVAPLPLACLAWGLIVERSRWREIAARLAPLAAVIVLWLGANLAVRGGTSSATAFLRFDGFSFAAGVVHGVQSLLGLDHPPALVRIAAGWREALSRVAWPLAAFAAAGLLLPTGRASAPAESRTSSEPPTRRRALAFAACWFGALSLAAGPVAHTWSSYYYTVAAVGGAIAVATLARDARFGGWMVACVSLLGMHGIMATAPAFAVADRAWGWTSHLTPFYFERGAALTDSLARQVRRLEPAPPPGTRFFFATLPSYAGFQMGNGALIRTLYRDSTLASYFYSQFSDSTAADRPLRFFYWDGARLARLDTGVRDPLFQVGTDLLLMNHLDGATHAFRRALAGSEPAIDNLYWLGWAELMRGRRGVAESAWRSAGFSEDSLAWYDSMRLARMALLDHRDTLETRRWLVLAIRYGVGRPDAHAVLGDLLRHDNLKYGLLELKVATWLNPRDWLARRDLFLGLVATRLDESAATELAVLRRVHPTWSSDSVLRPGLAEFERRHRVGVEQVDFGVPSTSGGRHEAR